MYRGHLPYYRGFHFAILDTEYEHMEVVHSRSFDLFYLAQPPGAELSIQKYRHCLSHHGDSKLGYLYWY